MIMRRREIYVVIVALAIIGWMAISFDGREVGFIPALFFIIATIALMIVSFIVIVRGSIRELMAPVRWCVVVLATLIHSFGIFVAVYVAWRLLKQ
jgi:hypothetical protein